MLIFFGNFSGSVFNPYIQKRTQSYIIPLPDEYTKTETAIEIGAYTGTCKCCWMGYGQYHDWVQFVSRDLSVSSQGTKCITSSVIMEMSGSQQSVSQYHS